MVDPIRAYLNIGDFQISLLQGLAFALFFSVMGLPMGRLADRMNRMHLIVMGIVFWSAMTIACGFATSFFALFLFRMGVGVGEAALAPAAYSILADSFPPHRLVRATSIFGQATTIGAGLSLLVGGQVIELMSDLNEMPFGLSLEPWQFAFVVVGLPGFVVAALILLMKEPTRRGISSDAKMSLVQALYQFLKLRTTLGPLYISGALLSIVNFGSVIWFPTHLIRFFGMTPGEVGVALGIIHITGGVLGAVLGTLIAEHQLRKGNRSPYLRTVFFVAILMTIAMVIPLIPDQSLMLWLWFGAVTVQGAYSGSVQAAIQLTAPNELRGIGTAVLLFMSNLIGLALGSALIGGVADVFFAGQQNGVGLAFSIVGLCVCALATGIALSALLRGRKESGQVS